jgi:hypothetical protein
MILAILLLFASTAWELYNDRDGEALSDKGLDVLLRVCFALAAAIIGYMLVDKPIIDGFILAMAIHFFAFDYLINYILWKRGVIERHIDKPQVLHYFEYLGNSWFDSLWKHWNPWLRFFVRLAFLVVSVVIYIL